jgi:transposase
MPKLKCSNQTLKGKVLMSDINYTSTLLNLKDQNLDFSDSRCEMSTIKGIETIVITAVLKNKPEVCPHCGGKHINVHGYKTANIKIPPVSEYSAILRLKKQTNSIWLSFILQL